MRSSSAGIDKQKRSIFKTVFRSMLLVIISEIVMLVGVLVVSGVSSQLDQNAVDILQKHVENRRNYLEKVMLRAQELNDVEALINQKAQELIDAGQLDMSTIDESSENALPLLSAIGEDLVSAMRYRAVTGIFVVINTHDLDARAIGDTMPGIYIRDLDPSTSPSEHDSDLLFERGPFARRGPAFRQRGKLSPRDRAHHHVQFRPRLLGA